MIEKKANKKRPDRDPWGIPDITESGFFIDEKMSLSQNLVPLDSHIFFLGSFHTDKASHRS